MVTAPIDFPPRTVPVKFRPKSQAFTASTRSYDHFEESTGRRFAKYLPVIPATSPDEAR